MPWQTVAFEKVTEVQSLMHVNVTPAYITASCQGHSANEIWISTQVNDKASRIVLLSSTESGRRLVPAYSYPYDRANQPDEYGFRYTYGSESGGYDLDPLTFTKVMSMQSYTIGETRYLAIAEENCVRILEANKHSESKSSSSISARIGECETAGFRISSSGVILLQNISRVVVTSHKSASQDMFILLRNTDTKQRDYGVIIKKSLQARGPVPEVCLTRDDLILVNSIAIILDITLERVESRRLYILTNDGGVHILSDGCGSDKVNRLWPHSGIDPMTVQLMGNVLPHSVHWASIDVTPDEKYLLYSSYGNHSNHIDHMDNNMIMALDLEQLAMPSDGSDDDGTHVICTSSPDTVMFADSQADSPSCTLRSPLRSSIFFLHYDSEEGSPVLIYESVDIEGGYSFYAFGLGTDRNQTTTMSTTSTLTSDKLTRSTIQESVGIQTTVQTAPATTTIVPAALIRTATTTTPTTTPTTTTTTTTTPTTTVQTDPITTTTLVQLLLSIATKEPKTTESLKPQTESPQHTLSTTDNLMLQTTTLLPTEKLVSTIDGTVTSKQDNDQQQATFKPLSTTSPIQLTGEQSTTSHQSSRATHIHQTSNLITTLQPHTTATVTKTTTATKPSSDKILTSTANQLQQTDNHKTIIQSPSTTTTTQTASYQSKTGDKSQQTHNPSTKLRSPSTTTITESPSIQSVTPYQSTTVTHFQQTNSLETAFQLLSTANLKESLTSHQTALTDSLENVKNYESTSKTTNAKPKTQQTVEQSFGPESSMQVTTVHQIKSSQLRSTNTAGQGLKDTRSQPTTTITTDPQGTEAGTNHRGSATSQQNKASATQIISKLPSATLSQPAGGVTQNAVTKLVQVESTVQLNQNSTDSGVDVETDNQSFSVSASVITSTRADTTWKSTPSIIDFFITVIHYLRPDTEPPVIALELQLITLNETQNSTNATIPHTTDDGLLSLPLPGLGVETTPDILPNQSNLAALIALDTSVAGSNKYSASLIFITHLVGFTMLTIR